MLHSRFQLAQTWHAAEKLIVRIESAGNWLNLVKIQESAKIKTVQATASKQQID